MYVSTKYSIFFILFRVVYSYIASLRACVLACLADLPPVRAARQRVGCRHADRRSGYTKYVVRDCTAVQRHVCLYESYAIIKTIPVTNTGYSSTFLNGAISSEYHTHRAPSLTRRLYTYIISLGVTILRLVLPVTHLELV